MVNKYILVALTLIVQFISRVILKMSFLKSGIITISIITLGYIVYMKVRGRERYSILERDLDPERFIEATREAYRYAGKNKELNGLFNMDMAYAYIYLGDYEKAFDYASNLDIKYIPRDAAYRFNYYRLMMKIYYNLKDPLAARKVYLEAEKELTRKKNQKALDYLKSYRAFYEGDYEAVREDFEGYLELKPSRLSELETLYILASIDESQGKEEEATKKFRRLAEEAEKLAIGKISREKLA